MVKIALEGAFPRTMAANILREARTKIKPVEIPPEYALAERRARMAATYSLARHLARVEMAKCDVRSEQGLRDFVALDDIADAFSLALARENERKRNGL